MNNPIATARRQKAEGRRLKSLLYKRFNLFQLDNYFRQVALGFSVNGFTAAGVVLTTILTTLPSPGNRGSLTITFDTPVKGAGTFGFGCICRQIT